ncbi:unnamed protein product [Peniophora sp. CBMAI 1063]|nr:unnamed protein product [Peniophora sp. CBMAI 1063]
MDFSGSGPLGPPGSVMPKAEDSPKDLKPTTKTLNRVPRACNACRKQKMRCEGADNPPCRRCRHAGLECLFEKPSREASLTGEAGLERIRSLENQVADVRQGQINIQNTLAEIVGVLRGGPPPHMMPNGPYPQPPYTHPSPSVHSASPALSTPSTVRPPLDPQGHPVMAPNQVYHGQPTSPTARGPQDGPPGQYPHQQPYPIPVGMHPPMLPPFYNESMGPPRGPPPQQAQQQQPPQNVSSLRNNLDPQLRTAGMKRPISSAISANSSDVDDEQGELPASGLTAPWEVLRGLADVAIQRAAKENGEYSEPPSRARSPVDGPDGRPAKRQKTSALPRHVVFQDVVSKGIISEAEARELFRIYYHGCSTFLPIFDSSRDTYDSLHARSPFAVNAVCMVAAQVRDGGGKPSDVYKACLAEVQSIACATLFSPVIRYEAVQAMVLIAGWSENGWLSGGHAVRMAMELGMHKAWPRLVKRMDQGKHGTGQEDVDLITATRTWFCLYLFEHQLSYGTGRPAILKDDESIWKCRLLLHHPLSIEDDMRLVSTVELMAIRERVHNLLAPLANEPLDDRTFKPLHIARDEFKKWYQTWDTHFSTKYENAAFYRQSLEIQHLHADLYHTATALKGINGPEDVQNMSELQRSLAINAIHTARQCLEISLSSPAYREGMKYAVHYTHATATFTASFLLRLGRLFPAECDMQHTRALVEQLAALMSEIPGKRYALTLQLMLKRSTRRGSVVGHGHRGSVSYGKMAVDRPSNLSVAQVINNSPTPVSPTSSYEVVPQQHGGPQQYTHQQQMPMHPAHQQVLYQAQQGHTPNADNIWRGFEQTSSEQLPVWLSDQSLGGNSFSQSGIDAFLLPNDYLPPAPQIW